MFKISNLLSEEELTEKLSCFPKSYSYTTKEEALLKLQDLYTTFIPTKMSKEIYYKLYFAYKHSIDAKNQTIEMNRKRIQNATLRTQQGVMGGLNSLTVLGTAGIGKTATIKRVAEVIGPEILENDEHLQKVIPFVFVQTPFDCSVKSLLLNILFTMIL